MEYFHQIILLVFLKFLLGWSYLLHHSLLFAMFLHQIYLLNHCLIFFKPFYAFQLKVNFLLLIFHLNLIYFNQAKYFYTPYFSNLHCFDHLFLKFLLFHLYSLNQIQMFHLNYSIMTFLLFICLLVLLFELLFSFLLWKIGKQSFSVY